MNLTDQEAAGLRAKAEAALAVTAEPWQYDDGKTDGDFRGKPQLIQTCNHLLLEPFDMFAEEKSDAVCRHVVASQPATLLRLLDDRDRLIEEIARLRAEAEWRPISTAPKDGTEIDVLIDACERYANVAYESGEWWIETYDKAIGDVRIAIRRQLTHWRPLPQPPEAV